MVDGAMRRKGGAVSHLASRLQPVLPVIALVFLLTYIGWNQPRALSYFGANLLLGLSLPIVLCTLAQVFVMAVGDLDLSIGSFVSLVACIGATILPQDPFLATAALVCLVAVYALVGALIQFRRVPSIILTLGLSFVWTGLALIILPVPGGKAPEWVSSLVGWKTPIVPMMIWMFIILAAVGHLIIIRSSWGTMVRAAGANPSALERSGWSLVRMKAGVYAAAGVCGIVAGLVLVGNTVAANATVANQYTLLSVAAAVLGGADFSGGRVSPTGAVLGGIIMSIVGSLLIFMNISTDWQVATQGVILIAVLSLQFLLQRLSGTRVSS
ncbi:ABC transporter permease [Mesorhizobium sp. M1D.F.Ca.ET.043.01.1.1]|uniref:ABC transporter permease n=1 Tax=Mesorhizobium sp. M1D.F.Ca.ET.043.01.1.1 TaxID=2493669 RepID=UPI001FE1E1F7|nr:ABC transporter permease [Mesorhizobium sp. M1D.F.Ca.ET.043.01.1.1]